MDYSTIIAASIAAIPATIAAVKANSGIRETRRLRSMLHAHLTDPDAHQSRPRAVKTRREGGR